MSDYRETGEATDTQPQQNEPDMARIQASMQGLREQQDRELREDLEKFENRPKPPYIEAQQNIVREPEAYMDEGVRWEDRGLMDIPVADLPWPEDIQGPQDFDHHISYPKAVRATKELQQMRPLIERGYTSDDFAQADRANGVDYENGQQRIYELFYGSRAIQVDKDGNHYDVVAGRHRVYVAKEQGLDSLPARVREKVKE